MEREVKFEAQLYKMRDGEYALDFQVGGGLLLLRLAPRGCAVLEAPLPLCRKGGCTPRLAAHHTPAPGAIPLCLQRLSGDLFLFMDTCSSLLSVLRL